MSNSQQNNKPRIPTRPRCARCERYITIDTDADDDLWLEVIGPLQGTGYICADCFTRAADERLIRWEGRLRLVPYSLAQQIDVQAEATEMLSNNNDQVSDCSTRLDNEETLTD